MKEEEINGPIELINKDIENEYEMEDDV